MRKDIVNTLPTLARLSFLILLSCLHGLGQSTKTYTSQVPAIIGPHSGQPPVADFSKEIGTTPDSQRITKDDRFRHPRGPISDPGLIANGSQEDIQPWIVDYVGPTEPIPVAHSTAILIGTVSSGQAHIGYDRSSVYSEFKVTPQQILKQDSKVPLALSDPIVVTREGGTIKFPSGHIRHYLRLHQGFPDVGKQYIFFLWRSPDTTIKDYGVVTAYLLQDGRVYPLDSDNQFTQFEGESSNQFLSQLNGGIR